MQHRSRNVLSLFLAIVLAVLALGIPAAQAAPAPNVKLIMQWDGSGSAVIKRLMRNDNGTWVKCGHHACGTLVISNNATYTGTLSQRPPANATLVTDLSKTTVMFRKGSTASSTKLWDGRDLQMDRIGKGDGYRSFAVLAYHKTW